MYISVLYCTVLCCFYVCISVCMVYLHNILHIHVLVYNVHYIHIPLHYIHMYTCTQSFHATVEHVAGKWVRRNREMPEPELGATLPV